MKAVVVCQSLWGNTAQIARAIGEGLGKGTRVLSTSEAVPDALRGVDLVVAGSPVHAFNLPSADTVAEAGRKPDSYGKEPPDTSQQLMRDWLKELPAGLQASAAAFETGVAGPLGRGAASRILKRLSAKGLAPIERKRFRVGFSTSETTTKGQLVDGETERARAWGRELAASLASGAKGE